MAGGFSTRNTVCATHSALAVPRKDMYFPPCLCSPVPVLCRCLGKPLASCCHPMQLMQVMGVDPNLPPRSSPCHARRLTSLERLRLSESNHSIASALAPRSGLDWSSCFDGPRQQVSLMVSFWPSPMIDIYGLRREVNLRRVKCGFRSEHRELGMVIILLPSSQTTR